MKETYTWISQLRTTLPFWVQSLVLILVLCLGRLVVSGDVGTFILLNEKRISAKEYDQNVTPRNAGYDGQFFYRYALDPFSDDRVYQQGIGDYGILIDDPSYRRSRVLYPTLAWALAFGQEGFVPYSLILVNVLAFVLLCVGFERVVVSVRAPAESCYLSWFIFGAYLSTARSLSDLLATTCLVWCYIFMTRQRYLAFTVVAAAALFSKETSAFFLAPMMVWLGCRDMTWPTVFVTGFKRAVLALPVLAFILWKGFLSNLYGSTSSNFGDLWSKHFGLPFVGMLESMNTGVMVVKAGYLVWTLILFGLCIRQIYRQRLALDVLQSFVWIGLLLTVSFAQPIYTDHWSFVRVLAPIHVFGLLFLVRGPRGIPNWFWGVSWLALLGTLLYVVRFA
ncbi:MAG: hypothetical protein AAFQ02_06190 [Bacteroidota bacterium]